MWIGNFLTKTEITLIQKLTLFPSKSIRFFINYFNLDVFGNLIWQIIEKGLILTERIVERIYKGELRFEFVNLNFYENDIYFISDILEDELDAEFIDIYHILIFSIISLPHGVPS